LIGTNTVGYVAADLHALCREAITTYLTVTTHSSLQQEFVKIIKTFVPSLRRHKYNLSQPQETKAVKIGGLHAVKAKIRQAIEYPMKYADRYAKLGLFAPKGVLCIDFKWLYL